MICLVNVTLTAKSALNTLQFARHMVVAIYHTAVGLEKCDGQTEKPITDATLILMDRQVQQTNGYITMFSIMFK